MIRPFTCLCLLVAAGSGLYLYSAKHDAQVLDRQIEKLRSQARASRSDASMLHAAYDRLGDPDRLRELATQVLTLQKTDPKQFVALGDIDKRLPPVGLPVAPEPAVVEPPAAEAPVVAAVAPPVAKSVVVAEKPKPIAPATMAQPGPATSPQMAQAVLVRPSVAPRPLMSVAQAAPVPTVTAPAPQPSGPMHVAMARPTPLMPTPAAAPHAQVPIQVAAVRQQALPQTPAAAPVTPPARPAFVGSALGMARYSNLANPIGANGRLAAQPAASVLTQTGYQPPALTR